MKNRILKLSANIIGLIFIVSGISKILVFDSFENSVNTIIPILPDLLLVFTAFLITSLEILGGVFVFIPSLRKKGMFLLSGLCAMFVVILIYVLIRDIPFICNCFGILGISFSIKTQLLIDLILLNSILYLLRIKKNESMNFTFKLILVTVISVLIFAITVLFDFKSDSSDVVEKFLESQNFNEKEIEYLFIVNTNMFACKICQDNFEQICKELEKKNIKNEEVLILSIDPEGKIFKNNQKRLNRWLYQVRINYFGKLVNNATASNFKEIKSYIIKLGNGDIEIKKELPLKISSLKIFL